MNPLISAIIPVYNPGEHLRKCLDSILGQTHRELEVILVDDGSTDGSDKVCDEYAAKDSRVVCAHQPNSGVSTTRNNGIALAHGDYIHFPDSDDFLEPDTYEYLLDLMNEHQVDAVNFEYFVTYPSHETTHLLSDDRYGLFDTEGAHRIVLCDEPFCCNKLYKRELVEGLTFRTDIFRGEDSLFAHQVLDRAEKVWFDKRPLYHYVQSEESACRGVFRPSQLSALKLYDAYEPLFKEKYPALYQPFSILMANLLTTLYYDMWADKKDYKEEQKNIKKEYKLRYKQIDLRQADIKQRVKLRLFRVSPWLFCVVHKTAHGL